MADNRLDNFALIADKIRLRSTNKGSAVQSNYEVTKRCLYGGI